MHEKVPVDMTTADFTSAAKRESHSANCPRFAAEVWFVPHGGLDLYNHPMHFGLNDLFCAAVKVCRQLSGYKKGGPWSLGLNAAD